MYFSKKLYISNEIENSFEIKEKLSNNITVSGIYLICIINDSKNMAEILSCKELFSKHNKRKNINVIGMAHGKKNAVFLLQRLMQDFINDGEHLENFKIYFK